VRWVLAVAACAFAAPALGQAPSPDEAAIVAARERGHAEVAARLLRAPDPARLAAARDLIEELMPADQREQMITAMLSPLMANIRQAVATSPQFATASGSDPAMKAIMDRFLERQHQRTIATMRAGLPGMIEAMTRAYARRFSLEDLAAYRTFFATPAGRRYMREAATIMSDPDVADWQRSLMTQSMAAIPAEIAQLADDVAPASENGK
jgi:hypothetical protein